MVADALGAGAGCRLLFGVAPTESETSMSHSLSSPVRPRSAGRTAAREPSLTIVAGEPGVGRTTFALHVAVAQARAKRPVCYLGVDEPPDVAQSRTQVEPEDVLERLTLRSDYGMTVDEIEGQIGGSSTQVLVIVNGVDRTEVLPDLRGWRAGGRSGLLTCATGLAREGLRPALGDITDMRIYEADLSYLRRAHGRIGWLTATTVKLRDDGAEANGEVVLTGSSKVATPSLSSTAPDAATCQVVDAS